MQIKKEEVRERLLASGRLIFHEEGFERASLRKIVKEAGTTIGNFYNYYPNKESLFEGLVDAEYKQFNYFLEHHEDSNDDHTVGLDDLHNHALIEEVLIAEVESMLPIFTPNFLLLIDSSRGTRYQTFKEDVIVFFTQHYLEFHQSQGETKEMDYSTIAGTMFVEGLIMLIRTTEDQKLLKSGIVNHFLFFIFGTMGLAESQQNRRRL